MTGSHPTTPQAQTSAAHFTTSYRRPVNLRVFYRKEREVDVPIRKLPAGTSIELRSEFTVPANAFGTMDFDSEVKPLWRLEPRIKLVGSPDWFNPIPITELPRVPA